MSGAWAHVGHSELTTNPWVLTVDPGLVHGLALLLNREVYTLEGDWQSGLDVVAWMIDSAPPGGVVVCESFIVNQETAKKSQAPWSLEGIGVVRFLSAQAGLEFVLQTPREAKAFSTTRRLKHRGWWFATKGGHANDALRHLYLFLAKRESLLPPEGVV